MPRISKTESRRKRHERLRRKVAGSAERPRLLIRRTLHHIYATVVDDSKGHTVVAVSTREKSVAGELESNTNVAAAEKIGQLIAEKAKQAGITQVVFDRSGLKYHGRVKALADAARQAGLEF
ncbi:MAG TPA: 50S ribosomal protein L18 [Candidatus Baltobacteraceae bacterium]|jgi:large subunit ribosomal protein L18|nr:50S ribosomal protein L18 [Candidatus Baltobacteraceae bacterium]